MFGEITHIQFVNGLKGTNPTVEVKIVFPGQIIAEASGDLLLMVRNDQAPPRASAPIHRYYHVMRKGKQIGGEQIEDPQTPESFQQLPNVLDMLLVQEVSRHQAEDFYLARENVRRLPSADAFPDLGQFNAERVAQDLADYELEVKAWKEAQVENNGTSAPAPTT